MAQMVERKVRSRAKQLYETRGQEEGHDLKDWFEAETEVLGTSILAPLYRRLRTGNQDDQDSESIDAGANGPASDSLACDTSA